MNNPQFVTKTDLLEALDMFGARIETMVGSVVGEIIGDALQMVSARFDKVDERFDRIETRLDRVETRLDKVEARLDGVEKKLAESHDIIDYHTVDIRALQRKIA